MKQICHTSVRHVTARNRVGALFALAFVLLTSQGVLSHAQSNKPLSLPFNTPPGKNTWLLSQQYGNTVGAFNYGRYWYAAGQNLHFGLDFWAPCGTPVLAVADGEVDQVDNPSFGLEPHNLTIFHRELGYTSIYGHLQVKPTVLKGQPVRRGEQIAVVGDADGTCVSRPHLHLEIRSRDYTIAYNPMPLIDADWSALATIGYHHFGGFTKDLYYPNRWQTYDAQPDVDFNERPLNDYPAALPVPARNAPPPITLPAFTVPDSPADAKASAQRLTTPGCCSQPSFRYDSGAVQFWNGLEGQAAQLFEVPIPLQGEPQAVAVANLPPQIYSNDGQFYLTEGFGRSTITRRTDFTRQEVSTGGAYPRFSPNSTRILWHRFPADNIPGGIPPLTEVWVANADGTGRDLLGTQQGGNVYWLDEDRILSVEPVGRTQTFKMFIWSISTRQRQELLTVKNLRGVQIAPGGALLLFYAPFQDDPNVSGVYGLVTQIGAQPIQLPFFSSYRWRDSKRILYLLYGDALSATLSAGAVRLAEYDVTTGIQRVLTDQPFRIANDDWHVSPNGRYVVYWSEDDSALWLLTLP
ncbi:MAG: hypothetical protein OHK0023_23190 [Anaerolineae bacterium]